ncbi:protein of unknown function [Caldanaerobius fijiensis DSM 17918]|uniref:Transglutaminase-like domain-containing protein n=1 Tax=Caldanaerobius fijiensis DSM 17918 TaxID=1121256 RepID=A0A1M4ZFH5_9THEO|nr:transglutaminase domain-containing protein [Caldanaerobius fijiensis]SHF16715.1 protein of unknown function [Caldanaerobius fijiensis DSM 17918]
MKTYKSLKVPSDMKKYLQLPEELPQRVKDLARQLTGIYDSPFEKAMAIQTYLRQFSYDLNVPAAPSNRDFTDYFLFDLKKGYCTYYASAMTVMLRSIGIPARYVTGFVYQSTGDENIKEDYKPVTNASAHAWVEAYFPGYGWINFEPTPFYLPLYFEASYSSSNSPWMVGPNGMTDWYMNIYANNSVTPSTSVIDNNSEHNVKDNKTDIAANKKDFARLKSKSEYNGKTNLKAMYIFIFLFFILIVSIVSSIIIKKKKLIAHMDPRERAIWQFEGILHALAKKGFVKRTGETVLEFADRVSKHLEYEINFRDVASAFNRIRYAKDLRAGDIEIVHKFYCMVKK